MVFSHAREELFSRSNKDEKEETSVIKKYKGTPFNSTMTRIPVKFVLFLGRDVSHGGIDPSFF